MANRKSVEEIFDNWNKLNKHYEELIKIKMQKTNWNEQFKIRLAKSDESMDKHDLIKILIVRKLLRQHRQRHFIRIYTEHSLNSGTGLKPDIMFQDLKNKSVIFYEIQKNLTEEYIKDRKERYDKVEIPFMKTTDLIIIPIKELSNDITELNKQLDVYVV